MIQKCTQVEVDTKGVQHCIQREQMHHQKARALAKKRRIWNRSAKQYTQWFKNTKKIYLIYHYVPKEITQCSRKKGPDLNMGD